MMQIAGQGKARNERLIHFFGQALGLLAFLAAIAGVIAILNNMGIAAVISHFTGSLCGGYAGSLADRRRLGSHFFAWIWAFALPLFGGCTAYLLLEIMKKPPTGLLFSEYAVYLNDAAAYKDSVKAHNQSVLMETVSLGDILANPLSDAEQRIAIEYLAEMETPEAYELLRKTVAITDNEAYFYAMTAMTQTEDKMLRQLASLEYSLDQTEAGQEDAARLLQIAASYFDFIYYQFAGGERGKEYLQKAEMIIKQVLDNKDIIPRDRNAALLLMGKVQLGLNNYENACKYFSEYIKENPESCQGYLWRAETWYNLGDYERVRSDCGKAGNIAQIPACMKAVLEFWLSNSRKESAPDRLEQDCKR